MRKFLVVAALLVGMLLTSAAAAETKAAPEPRAPGDFNGKFPAAGYWKVGGTPQQRTLYRTSDAWIVWNLAYVYQYDQVPTHWFAVVEYHNVGQQPLTADCSGEAPDPSRYREYVSRKGKFLGYVEADSTFCSENPSYSTSIPPGGKADDWALFNNVPWRRDKVSIEWPNPKPMQLPLRSRFVNPWGRHLR